jgi:tripartite-type tricarboxylate transporter receptor subunit TctC
MKMFVGGRLLVAALASMAAEAEADQIAEFYKDKQLQIIVRSSPGGSYDQYSRLVAGHIVRHLPGNPTYVVRYMTGAAGIQAVNYVENVAPKDGTVLTIVSNGLPMDQALGLAEGMNVDMKKLNWIGNITSSNEVIVAWHTSPVKTFEDARKTPIFLGVAAAASAGAKFGAVANNLLGTKFKVVYGYPGAADLNLAMERGETQGRANGLWATIKSTTPDWITAKKVYPLIQIGLKREPELPDVPLLSDLATNERDRAVLDFVTKGAMVGRPFAVASAVPKDRVEALRRAFDRTMKDPAFLADSERIKAEISPTSGEEMQRLIADIVDAPADVRARAKQAMELRPDDSQAAKGRAQNPQ